MRRNLLIAMVWCAAARCMAGVGDTLHTVGGGGCIVMRMPAIHLAPAAALGGAHTPQMSACLAAHAAAPPLCPPPQACHWLLWPVALPSSLTRVAAPSWCKGMLTPCPLPPPTHLTPASRPAGRPCGERHRALLIARLTGGGPVCKPTARAVARHGAQCLPGGCCGGPGGVCSVCAGVCVAEWWVHGLGWVLVMLPELAHGVGRSACPLCWVCTSRVYAWYNAGSGGCAC